jgi:hypothetical protein
VDYSWFMADAESWHKEVGYNSAVALALECATSHFQSDVGVDPAVFDCIVPVLDAPMAKSQRLRILLILIAYKAAEDPPTGALRPLAEALRLTRELDELRARLAFLLESAYINRYMSRYADAQENLREYLNALETLKLRGEWRPDDSIAALHSMLRRAQVEFNLGDTTGTTWWLNESSVLLAQIGEHTDSQGRLAWMRALVHRQEGEYTQALSEAITAVGYYRKLHDPEMLSRIEGVTGEILLDLAEESRDRGAEAACGAYLAQAEPYIGRAVQVAFAGHFAASEALARIIRARWQLLQGISGDRKPLLEELARQARQNQDMLTACLAYTAIGQECEAVFDLTSAKDWYRRAIAVVKDLKIESVAVWPKRALARLEKHSES